MIDKTITPYPPMDSPTVNQPSGRRTPFERFCDDDDGDVDGDVDGDDDDATNRANTLQPCAFQGADGPISWGGG